MLLMLILHKKVCGIFLGSSKAFDKVWYDGPLQKIQNNGTDPLCLIKSFLHNRHQSVVLNGSSSIWKPITAGVLQCSVFDPLIFLIYINGLKQGLLSKVKHFADDTSAFFGVIVWIFLTWWPYKIGHTNRKCHSTLTKINKLKRSYLLEKPNQLFIHDFSLINWRLNLPQPRNTLVWIVI